MFLDDQGRRESSNRYDVVNGWGYMESISLVKELLNHSDMMYQKGSLIHLIYKNRMLDLLNHNKKILQKYIDYWDGKTINGRTITKWNTVLTIGTW